MMSISESCYRYSSKNKSENDIIANFLLKLLDDKHKCRWGFGLCFDHIRNVKGYKWNHKRVYRIYCELELNLRIKPWRRIKRDKPEALSVPTDINKMWSMDFMSDSLHEWLDKYLFDTIQDAQELATKWLWTYNNERPHKANNGYPPRMVLGVS